MNPPSSSPLKVILSGDVRNVILEDEMKLDLFEAALEFIESLGINHLALSSPFTRIVRTFKILKKERNLKMSVVSWLKNLHEVYLVKLDTILDVDVDHLINDIELRPDSDLTEKDYYSAMARGELFLSDFAGIVKDMAEFGSPQFPCLTHLSAIVKGIKYTGSGYCSNIDDIQVVATTSVIDLKTRCEQATTHCGDKTQDGYEIELFVNNDVKKLALCSICRAVLRKPKRCPLGHLFCLSCIEELFLSCKKGKAACPMCRINLPGVALLHTDNFAESYVNMERVRCYNSCAWKGQLQELKHHVYGQHCANRLTSWGTAKVWVDPKRNIKEVEEDEQEVMLVSKQFVTHLLSFFRMRLQHDPLLDGLAFAQSVMWPLEKNGSIQFGRKAKRMFVAVNDFHYSGLTIFHSLAKDGRDVYTVANMNVDVLEFRSIHLNDPDETKSDKSDSVVYQSLVSRERLYERQVKRKLMLLLVGLIIAMWMITVLFKTTCL